MQEHLKEQLLFRLGRWQHDRGQPNKEKPPLVVAILWKGESVAAALSSFLRSAQDEQALWREIVGELVWTTHTSADYSTYLLFSGFKRKQRICVLCPRSAHKDFAKEKSELTELLAKKLLVFLRQIESEMQSEMKEKSKKEMEMEP